MISVNLSWWTLKKLLILDTTICIDLFNGQLLEKVLVLPYEFTLPDVIVAELIDPPGDSLLQLGYSVQQLPAEDIRRFFALRAKYTKPSTNDLFALLIAKINNCTLITGDRDLRVAAQNEEVAVHGLLWLLDRLVEYQVLGKANTADSLERIIASGSWLPKRECDIRLKRWRS